MTKERAPGAGRPRDGFGISESGEQFAALWKYPLALVSLGRKNNLPGFLKGSRIDPLLAIPALNELAHKLKEMPEGCKTWKEVGDKYRGLKAQIEYDEKRKSVMPTEDAKRQNGEAWNYIFAEIERLCVEAPPDYAGRTAIELHGRLVKWRENMRTEAKKRFEEAA